MTIVVGVAATHTVSIAADSLRVDMNTGASSRVNKICESNGLVAALAGVSDLNGVNFLDTLDVALQQCQRINQIPGTFLKCAGDNLAGAYARWRVFTQDAAPVESFVEIVAAQVYEGAPTLLQAWTAIENDKLTMRYELHSATGEHAAVVAAGSTLIVSDRTTEHVEHVQLMARLQRASIGDPLTRIPATANTADEATRLIEETISRQNEIPRPAWWGLVTAPNTPVVAEPVLCHSLG